MGALGKIYARGSAAFVATRNTVYPKMPRLVVVGLRAGLVYRACVGFHEISCEIEDIDDEPELAVVAGEAAAVSSMTSLLQDVGHEEAGWREESSTTKPVHSGSPFPAKVLGVHLGDSGYEGLKI